MNDCLADFQKLYQLYYRRMVVYTSGFSAVPVQERTDLAHDILVHVWLKRDMYRPGIGTNRSEEQKLNAWVYALARNFILDRIRTHRMETVPFIEEQESGDGSKHRTPEEAVISSNLIKSIQKGIDAMDERDREIAQLVFFEQLSAAETARIMRIPGATVRWRLMLMRKVLARIVEEQS